jgi:phosphomannomutase
MTRIRFGTDGWRGIIAADYTFDAVRACAEGFARYLEETGVKRGVVVGYDTRFAAEDFALAAAEVLCAHQIPVFLTPHPTPTPVVAHGILQLGADGAVVITASHNPWRWLGFKVRPSYGGSAPPPVLQRIEALIPAAEEWARIPRLRQDEARRHGLLQDFDPTPGYIRHVEELLDMEAIRGAGLRVVVDPMHGAAAGYLLRLLAGSRTKVWQIRGGRNPIFPGMANPEPIARNLKPLSRAIRRHDAHVGLATDGDGDRLGVVDENGRFLDNQRTFALLTYYLMEVRGLRGPIVKSVTATRMVFPLAQPYSLPIYETGVGFKFLGPKMMEVDAIIAGEESGGCAFRGHLPERDGIFSALCFLDLMVKRGKTPSQLVEELFSRIGPHHYDRIDVEIDEGRREELKACLDALSPSSVGGLQVVGRDTIDGVRLLLDRGWVIFRLSGTEPLLRIYSEVRGEAAEVQRVLADARRLVGV